MKTWVTDKWSSYKAVFQMQIEEKGSKYGK